MLFDELFESSFRNIPLVRVPFLNQSKDGNSTPRITLEHLFSSSQYVIFFLAESSQSTSSSSRTLELAGKLEEMVQKKNAAFTGEKTSSSPARIRRFFGIKKKKKVKENGSDSLSISVVLLETSNNQENVSNLAQPGWYQVGSKDLGTRSRLLRGLGFEVAPSIVVVEGNTRAVITTEARRLLHDDPIGQHFPWWPPSVENVLLNASVQRRDQSTKNLVKTAWKELPAKVRALFFGAYWCPPCRQWIKQLIPAYESLKKNGISLEIIFCSSDRSQEFYDEFTGMMPWMAFPFDPSHTVLLTRLFNISGIPSLILIDEENRVITRHGRQTLVDDPKGVHFPWGPRPIYELTELNVCRLRDEPSLILFTEGSQDDIQFSKTVLSQVARRLFLEKLDAEKKREIERKEKSDENGNGNSRSSTPQLKHSTSQEECSSVDSEAPIPALTDPLQVFFTGEDPICDHILEEILGLADAELPLICIVDALGGRLTVCPDPDVSDEVLTKFVDSYRMGKLCWTPLSDKSGRTVGGIPVDEIEKVLMGNSPSQNSIGTSKDATNT
ncbi:unnamed protein product, partial [Mesorhabditis belari]|uniref:Thioredoxin domain-containing protein n=1 Tax=Mesorhabditis belari TaxID=2138241 RepID=A0AAF3E8B0_9BILA